MPIRLRVSDLRFRGLGPYTLQQQWKSSSNNSSNSNNNSNKNRNYKMIAVIDVPIRFRVSDVRFEGFRVHTVDDSKDSA